METRIIDGEEWFALSTVRKLATLIYFTQQYVLTGNVSDFEMFKLLCKDGEVQTLFTHLRERSLLPAERNNDG